MIILGIESSTKNGSIALLEDDILLSQINFNDSLNHHSEKIFTILDFMFQDVGCGLNDIGLIGVNIGPGSFTSLRVGLSLAKGLSFSKGIPLKGVDSLSIIAYQSGIECGSILSIIDAKRGKYYTAIYNDLKILHSPELLNLDKVISLIKENNINFISGIFDRNIFSGLGLIQIEQKYIFANSVAELVRLKYSVDKKNELNSIEPLYLR